MPKELRQYMACNGSLCDKRRSNLHWIFIISKSFKIIQIFVSKRDKQYKNWLLLIFVETPLITSLSRWHCAFKCWCSFFDLVTSNTSYLLTKHSQPVSHPACEPELYRLQSSMLHKCNVDQKWFKSCAFLQIFFIITRYQRRRGRYIIKNTLFLIENLGDTSSEFNCWEACS